MAEIKRKEHRGSFEVCCPCCGARLTIDSEFSKVLLSQPPEKGDRERELDHARQTLERDAARRDSLFQRSMEDEKTKPELLERKFQEALKKSKNKPVTPPLRDMDLD